MRPVGLHSTQVFQDPLSLLTEGMKGDPVRLLHPKLCEACPLFCGAGALGINQASDVVFRGFRPADPRRWPESLMFVQAAEEAF